MKRRQVNKSGFSLVETIVAMGLVGGLAVAVFQMTGSISQSKTADAATSDYFDLNDQLSQLFSNSSTCTTSILGSGAAPIIIGDKVNLLPGGTPPTKGVTHLTALYNSLNTALITAGQKFQKLLVTNIQIAPLTSPLPADAQGNVSQYGQMFISVALDLKKPDQTQYLNYEITIVKNGTSNAMASCTSPQPWTGSVLGLNKACSTDSALSWDGVAFSCKKIKCPLNSIQTGLDGKNVAVCTSLPTCSQSTGATVPNQALIYRNGAFTCKGVLCPTGTFSIAMDSDGFITACGPMKN